MNQDSKASAEHQDAIIAVLEAAVTALRPIAETRCPHDLTRQHAYMTIVMEDAGMAAKFGAQVGLGLPAILVQVQQLKRELCG